MLFLHTVHGIDAAYLTLAGMCALPLSIMNVGAFSVLLLCKPEEIKHTFELLEWETLLFFAGLFVMIEGMNEMGVIRAIGNVFVLSLSLMWTRVSPVSFVPLPPSPVSPSPFS